MALVPELVGVSSIVHAGLGFDTMPKFSRAVVVGRGPVPGRDDRPMRLCAGGTADCGRRRDMVRKPKKSSSKPCKGGVDLFGAPLVWGTTSGSASLGFLTIKVKRIIEINSENKIDKIAVTKQ